MKIPFKAGNILIPKNVDMHKLSVVACDQYTSEPEYWKEVEKHAKSRGNQQRPDDDPSQPNVVLPEVRLKHPPIEQKDTKHHDIAACREHQHPEEVELAMRHRFGLGEKQRVAEEGRQREKQVKPHTDGQRKQQYVSHREKRKTISLIIHTAKIVKVF